MSLSTLDSFWDNIFRTTDEDPVHALLRDIPLFDGLSRAELSTVASVLHRREYESSEIVFQQGYPGVGMYIIREGDVEIVYEPTNDILAHLEDGDFFGELALLNETPRSATAVARSDAILYGLFRPDLLGLVEHDSSLGVQVLLRMARVISQRLIHVNEQVQALRERLDDTSSSPNGDHSEGPLPSTTDTSSR